MPLPEGFEIEQGIQSMSLPEGFEIEKPVQAQPLPEGFELESVPETDPYSHSTSTTSWQPPPSEEELFKLSQAEGQPQVEPPGILGRVKESWTTGKRIAELGQLRYRQLIGEDSEEIEQRIAELGTSPEPSPSKWGLPEKAVRAAAEMLPIQLQGMEKGAKRGLALGTGAAGITALAGQAGPQAALPEELITVPTAAAGGFAVGMTSGTLENIGQIEAGLAYDELLNLKDAHGNRIDPTIAKSAAAGVGVVNGLIELAQIKLLLKTIPGGEKLLQGAVRKVVSKVATSKTLTGLALKHAARYGKFIVGETAQEIAQESTNILANEVAKELDKDLKGSDIPRATREEITGRLIETAKQSALAFSVMGLPGSAVSAGLEAKTLVAPQTEVASDQAALDVATQKQTMLDNLKSDLASGALSVADLQEAVTLPEIQELGLADEIQALIDSQAEQPLAEAEIAEPVEVATEAITPERIQAAEQVEQETEAAEKYRQAQEAAKKPAVPEGFIVEPVEKLTSDTPASKIKDATMVNDESMGQIKQRVLEGNKGVKKELEGILKEHGRKTLEDWMNPLKMRARLKADLDAQGMPKEERRAKLAPVIAEYEKIYNEVRGEAPVPEGEVAVKAEAKPAPVAEKAKEFESEKHDIRKIVSGEWGVFDKITGDLLDAFKSKQDAIDYEQPTIAPTIAQNKIGDMPSRIPIYRGETAQNKGGNYYSTDKEWARQFTQTGQESEVLYATIPKREVYQKEPLPKATNEADFDQAILEAKEKGFAAVWFDEGPKEPLSVYVIDKEVLAEYPDLKLQEVSQEAKPAPVAEKVTPTKEKKIADWEKRFKVQAKKVSDAEKTPGRKLEAWEVKLYEKDWKAYSKKRGYTKEEIADFQKYIDMVEEGKQLGLSEDDIFSLDWMIADHPRSKELVYESDEGFGAIAQKELIRDEKEVPTKEVTPEAVTTEEKVTPTTKEIATIPKPDKSIPQLISVSPQGSIVRISFDDSHRIPSADELKKYLEDENIKVGVTKFVKGVFTGPQRRTNYRIDVFDSTGKMSSVAAKTVVDKLGSKEFYTRTARQEAMLRVYAEREATKPTPGRAWIKNMQRTITSATEITEEKNKGKFEVTLPNGKKVIVERDDIKVWPGEKAEPIVDTVADAKIRLKAKIKEQKGAFSLKSQEGQAIFEDLVTVGKDVISQGHDTFTKFKAQMKQTLSDVWEKIRRFMMKVYASAKKALKSERGAIGGEKAIGAPVSKIAEAERLLAAGKTKGEVWERTGWLKGAEGKWKFEIDDSGAKLKNIKVDSLGIAEKHSMLGDILNHPELFKNYPKLANMLTTTMIDSDMKNPRGEHVLGRNRSGEGLFDLEPEIKIYAKNMIEAKATLLHEIQHAIQEIEGFAKGGSPESFPQSWTTTAIPKLQKEIGELQKRMVKATGSIRGILEERINNKIKTMGEWVEETKDLSPKKQYKRLAGEIEARDTAARAKLTPKQRKAQFPYESQGIPQEDWIITKGEGTSFSVEPKPTEKPVAKPEAKKPSLAAQKVLASIRRGEKGIKEIEPHDRTPTDKTTNAYSQHLKNWRTRTLDRLYPIMQKLDKGLDIKDPDLQAYIQTRMDASAPTVIATFLEHGKLKWLQNAPFVETKDKGFLRTIEKHSGNSKTVKSYDADVQNLLKDKVDFKNKHVRDIDRYFFWKIAKRAEMLTKQDREHLFDANDIVLLKKIAEKDWANSALDNEYVAFNKNVLDFATQIGIIDPAMRKVWEHDEYIPFYRILEDELAGEEFLRAPMKSRKFIDSQIKKLVGGKNKLGDPTENILRNWSHLISESIRNRSRTTTYNYMEKLGYAESSKPPKYIKHPEREAILSYMKNGRRKYFKVKDLELYNALSGANIAKFDGILAKMFGTSKRILTYGATFGPAFRVANFMRDTLQSAIINKSFVPVYDSLKGAYKAYTQHSDAIAMMSAGGGFSLGYVRGDDPQATAKHIRKIVRRVGEKQNVLSPMRWLEWWEKVGSASENAARVQLYANLRKKGTSHLVAGFKARDLLDFGLSGDSKLVQTMIRTLPFLNARMQGLYKMGRAYGEDRAAFLLKGTILAALSLAWWAGVSDDDRYKELEDWEKWTYRHFWIGDTHFRIPKAFEVDAIFGSSVETLADVMSKNEEGKHIMRFIGQTFRDTFALDVPQLFKPLYEQAKNELGFTGRPIVSEGLQNVEPGQQAQPWTSESLKLLGEKLNVSPLRAEALVRGYFATLGMFVLGGADILTQWVADFPESPSKRVDDYPLIGRFVRESPARHSKYISRFYEMATEMDKMVGTVNHFKKTGDFEKAKEYRDVNRKTLRYKKTINRGRKKLQNINNRIKNIHYHRDMTAGEKKRRIDELIDQRNQYIKNMYERLIR